MTGVGAILAMIGAAIAAILGVQWKAKRDGAKEKAQTVEVEQRREEAAKEDKGREAIAEEKAHTAGADNRAVVDRVRGRDDRWS